MKSFRPGTRLFCDVIDDPSPNERSRHVIEPSMTHFNGSVPEEVVGSASEDALDPSFAARHKRVDDYLNTALTIEDALRSNLAAINTDLMRQALYIENALRDLQSESPTSIEGASAQQSALNDLLRITKQIDRYAQLDIKLRAEKPGSRSG